MSLRVACASVAIALVLASAQAVPAHAQSAAGVWDVEGGGTVRGSGLKDTFSTTGTLTLDVDRTYALEIDGDPLIEVGAWFQDGKRIFLYTANLLDLITALEDEVSAAVAEPVEIVPMKSTSKAVLDPNTGLLSIKNKQVIKAFLLNSGMTGTLRTTIKITGTRAP